MAKFEPNSASASSATSSAFATRMLAASTCLSGTAKILFDRVFLSGEGEDRVRTSLNLSAQEFRETKSGMLRSLMAACQ